MSGKGMGLADLTAHLDAVSDALDGMGMENPLITGAEAEALRIGLMGGLTHALWLSTGEVAPGADPDDEAWRLLSDACLVFLGHAVDRGRDDG